MFTSQNENDSDLQFHCSICAMGYRSSAAARACEDGHLDEGLRPRPKKPRPQPLP